MPTALPDDQPGSRFGYFLLQAHIATEENRGRAVVSLTVEDLSSGEKRVFASIQELSRFLTWVMEPGGEERWAPPRADV